jgi:hypothetical protein
MTPNTDITATVFGGSGDHETSAYDRHVISNTEMCVALPWRFELTPRPKVKVTNNATQHSAIGTIEDVGPWNTDDPYWETGARPQAESGQDKSGRKTNKAGIDLSPAMAQVLSIDGKDLVDWEFIGYETQKVLAPVAPGPSSSATALVAIGSDKDKLLAVQHSAARKEIVAVGEKYPRDGCAITLSCLLQEAGFDVPDTYQAIALGALLKNKGWQPVPIGQQQAGDVGSTCGPTAHHGVDHIFLVLSAVNHDEMVIADNQQQAPHFRWASGKGGKSPTKFFLRPGTSI